jgi:hypothetical protein
MLRFTLETREKSVSMQHCDFFDPLHPHAAGAVFPA